MLGSEALWSQLRRRRDVLTTFASRRYPSSWGTGGRPQSAAPSASAGRDSRTLLTPVFRPCAPSWSRGPSEASFVELGKLYSGALVQSLTCGQPWSGVGQE